MRLINVLVVVFLLTAFAVGISVADNDMDEINIVLTNATIIATNFSLSNVSENAYIDGGFRVAEKFVHFTIVAGIEVMRMGILFGHENPDYFTPEFIIGIVKLLIWAMIISIMIVPMMYFLGFLIMITIWIIDKFKRRKNGEKINR